MFKPLLTLMRGTANRAVDGAIDNNALTILDQQIRDCGDAIGWGRKAMAVAYAQNRQEQCRVEKITGQIADLEERAVQALEAGDGELASEAAEAIASLENERDAASKALSGFLKEFERLRGMVRTSEQRLKELERGRRTVKTNDAVLKLRDKGLIAGDSHRNTLSEAEATLGRLQSRQNELDHATSALEELDAETSPKNLAERMADAGFGAPTQQRASDVLERLKAKSKPGSTPNQKPKTSKPNAA